MKSYKNSILVIILALVALFFCAKYMLLRGDIAYADRQVEVFCGVAQSARLDKDTDELFGKLNYLVNHYPSGSRFKSGSRIDSVIECVRGMSIDVIVDRLRIVAPEDLGENKDSWLSSRAKNY